MLSFENRVRLKLEAGAHALGVVVRGFSASTVELIGLAGFDYAWIDLEHGNAGFETAEELVRAADAVGIECMIRIPNGDPSNVLRALETGASMICVPRIETPDQAAVIAKAARYHPLGSRGFTTASRGIRYGFGANGQELLDASNARVLVIVQVETVLGLENADLIAAVPGVDVLLAGLGDLSQQIGRPGAFSDPDVVAAGQRIIASARRHGKHGAISATNAAAVRRWLDDGAALFFCGVDVTLLADALRNLRVACQVD